MSVDCRSVAYAFSNIYNPNRDDYLLDELEFQIIGKNKIFTKYNKDAPAAPPTQLILYIFPSTSIRVKVDIEEYNDIDIIRQLCNNKDIRVIVIFFTEGNDETGLPPLPPDVLECEWLEINKWAVQRKLIMNSVTTKSIEKLREYISCDAERITLHYGLVLLVLI